MNRRLVIAAAASALAWPMMLRAQQGGKVWRIGILLGASSQPEFGIGFLGGFATGMRELGYVDGTDFIIEWRSAQGD